MHNVLTICYTSLTQIYNPHPPLSLHLRTEELFRVDLVLLVDIECNLSLNL